MVADQPKGVVDDGGRQWQQRVAENNNWRELVRVGDRQRQDKHLLVMTEVIKYSDRQWPMTVEGLQRWQQTVAMTAIDGCDRKARPPKQRRMMAYVDGRRSNMVFFLLLFINFNFFYV
jgi:hypothetical protein